MNNYDAVLFIGFGGPEKQEDIMPFLEIVTRGRGIPKKRLAEVAHHYERMGGKSPINDITRQQATGLERELKTIGLNLKVYIGQRNWHPFLADTLLQMTSAGVKRAIGLPAAAHRSEPSLERYIDATERVRQDIGPDAPAIDYVNPWFDHPLFIEAIAARVKEIQGPPATWVFTAHSIPCQMAKISPYVLDLRRTAELVAQKFGQREWELAYTSRSGNPMDPWLEPDVCDVIKSDADKGIKDILLIPIGFIADHVEILFDLDIEAQTVAKDAGVTLRRTKSVGDHPLFCRLLAEVVRERMNSTEKSQQRSSKVPVYNGCYCSPGSAHPPCEKALAKLS